MTETRAPSTYLFDNAWQEAHRRLRLIEEVFDPTTFRGGSAMARCFGLTIEQLRDRMVAGGFASAELLDAALAELDRSELWFTPMAMVCAWGRR